MSGPALYPEWKEAAAAFIATSPKPGDMLREHDLERMLGITRPRTGTEKQFQESALRFLHRSQKFFDLLMRKHQIMFAREKHGWRVLAAHEVAPLTRTRSENEMLKALSRQRAMLAHTDLSQLDERQLATHAEVMVRSSLKLRALRSIEKEPVKLPQQTPALPSRARQP